MPKRIGAKVCPTGAMFEFLGGVPKLLRPDNLKAGVSHPSYYEPDINPTYHELAEHYGTVVVPTRVRKAKDKALGENAVLQVQRWIVAALRDRRFFSLPELNQAIRERLQWLNDRQRSDHGRSRRVMFEELEKQHLRALPARPFVYLQVYYAALVAVQAGQSAYRLPCHFQKASLQRAPPIHPAKGADSGLGTSGGGLHQREPTDRLSRTGGWIWLFDRENAHARQSPLVFGVVPRAFLPLGTADWTPYRSPDHGQTRIAQTPGASLSILFGYSGAVQEAPGS